MSLRFNFDLNDMFSGTRLTEIATPSQGIVTLDSDMSVRDVINTLHSRHINAAPVIEVHKGKQRFLGVVDVARVTEFILREASKASKPVVDLNTSLSEDIFATPITELLRELVGCL